MTSNLNPSFSCQTFFEQPFQASSSLFPTSSVAYQPYQQSSDTAQGFLLQHPEPTKSARFPVTLPYLPNPDSFRPIDCSYLLPNFSTSGSSAMIQKKEPSQSQNQGVFQVSESDFNFLDAELSKKKRGKYKIYSEEEKSEIVEYAKTYGIDQALEEFSGPDHRLDYRKIMGWIEGSEKPKIRRKSGDTNRDHALYDWFCQFQAKNGRPPTRKEASIQTLKLSNNPKFKASKGYLDKFGKKFNIEFTPIKVFSNRKRKGSDESDETASTNATPKVVGNNKKTSSLSNFVQDRKTDSVSSEGIYQEEDETSLSKQALYEFQRVNFLETETSSELKRSEEDEIDKFFSNFASEKDEEISEMKPRLGWEDDSVFEGRQFLCSNSMLGQGGFSSVIHYIPE